MKSERTKTTVLQMTSMPVLVTWALLLLLVLGSLAVTVSRAAEGMVGVETEAGDAAMMEPQRSSAIALDLVGA